MYTKRPLLRKCDEQFNETFKQPDNFLSTFFSRKCRNLHHLGTPDWSGYRCDWLLAFRQLLVSGPGNRRSSGGLTPATKPSKAWRVPQPPRPRRCGRGYGRGGRKLLTWGPIFESRERLASRRGTTFNFKKLISPYTFSVPVVHIKSSNLNKFFIIVDDPTYPIHGRLDKGLGTLQVNPGQSVENSNNSDHSSGTKLELGKKKMQIRYGAYEKCDFQLLLNYAYSSMFAGVSERDVLNP
ncbi:hypothetical protein HUJ04_007142 [Dendroctonus ponderosae]|nr:hypothetical protein HUJ04_007142 [Dendroctonus ponderosae]